VGSCSKNGFVAASKPVFTPVSVPAACVAVSMIADPATYPGGSTDKGPVNSPTLAAAVVSMKKVRRIANFMAKHLNECEVLVVW
jgi:hypothetical protein